MDTRLHRTIALLIVVGGVLLAIGVVLLLRAQPEVSTVRVDGLNNGLPLPELPEEPGDPVLGRVVGGALAFVGAMTALVGAVAIGVRLALSDRDRRGS